MSKKTKDSKIKKNPPKQQKKKVVKPSLVKKQLKKDKSAKKILNSVKVKKNQPKQQKKKAVKPLTIKKQLKKIKPVPIKKQLKKIKPVSIKKQLKKDKSAKKIPNTVKIKKNSLVKVENIKENIKIKQKKTISLPISTKKLSSEKNLTKVLAVSNTIPLAVKNEISILKIEKISNSITNPIKKTESYAIKPEKEPNGKYELEFIVHSSAEMLYEFLFSSSGLSEWFCDDLNIRNGIYTFIWEEQYQQARLLKTVEFQSVRFQWIEKTDGSFFEFKIQRDELTNDISLIITDFADTESEKESSKRLWKIQVEKLMHVLGSIY